jgi:SAM-dependent methyltransferase
VIGASGGRTGGGGSRAPAFWDSRSEGTPDIRFDSGEQIHAQSFRNEVVRAYDVGSIQYAERWNVPHPWLDWARAQLSTGCTGHTRFCDVGCGPGVELSHWRTLGVELEGVDISAEMVRLARERNPGVPIHVGSAQEPVGLHGDYDIIWVGYCLLHLPPNRVPAAIEGLAKMLRPGGRLFVATPVAPQTSVLRAPISGLMSEQGEQLYVPSVFWSVDDLVTLFRAVPLICEQVQVARPLTDRGDFYAAILTRPV